MAITFNTTRNFNTGNGSGVQGSAATQCGVWTWNGTTLSSDYKNTAAFDYFTNSVAVNEALYIGINAKTTKIYFRVGTARNGTVTLVWEYYKDNGDRTATWTAFTPTSDATNNFTTTGADLAVVLPIDSMPGWCSFNWVNWLSDGFTTSLRCDGAMIRCRVSASSGATEGGANSTAVPKWDDYTVNLGTGYDTGTFESGTAYTATDTGKAWTTNILAGRMVRITAGTGIGQARWIASNTGTVITVESAWTVNPGATSVYYISNTLNDIKTADTAGSWGVVTKDQGTYTIKANVRLDANAFLSSRSEVFVLGSTDRGFEISSAIGAEIYFGDYDVDTTLTRGDTTFVMHNPCMKYSYLQGYFTMLGGYCRTIGYHGIYTSAVSTTLVNFKNVSFNPEQGVFGGKFTMQRVNILNVGKYSSFYIMPMPDATFKDVLFSQSAINSNPNYLIVFDACTWDMSPDITGTATSYSASRTMNDTSKNWDLNQMQGRILTITAGTGAGQERTIATNTTTQLITTTDFTTGLDNTSVYSIKEPWRIYGNPSGSVANNYLSVILKNCVITNPDVYQCIEATNGLFRAEHNVDWTSDYNIKDTAGANVASVNLEVKNTDGNVATLVDSGAYMSSAIMDNTTWGQTTVVTNDGTKFTNGDVIYIDLEKMLVTNIATNTLTVTRAYAGTFVGKHNPLGRTDIKIYKVTPYITSDASGNTPQQQYTATNYHFFGNTSPAPDNDFAKHSKAYNPYSIKVRKYGYFFQTLSKAFTAKDVGSITMATNPYAATAVTTVDDYTGIAINGSAKTITLTSAHTVAEVYEYTQYWAALGANLQYDEPITTTDGTNYMCAKEWTVIGAETYLTSTTKVLTEQNASGTMTYAYVALFLNSIVNGSTYRISKTSDNSSLFAGTASSTTVTTTRYKWSVDLGVTIRVRKAGYVPFEVTGTITQNGLSVTISQTVDSVYQA